MKKLLTLLFLFAPFYVYNQAAKINSSYCYGSSGSELCNDVSASYDGNYWLAGFSSSADGDVSSIHGAYDYWVCKVNTSGTVLQEKSYGGGGDDFAESIEELPDSGRIIFGTTYSSDGDVIGWKGGSDFWLVRVKKNGAFKWRKTFGGTLYDIAGQMCIAPDDQYYCAGKTNSKNGNVTGKHKLYDAWVIKVDVDGNLVWQKCVGGNGDDEAHAICTTSDGGCIIAGSANKGGGDAIGWHGSNDFFVAKLDAAGVVEWSKCYGGSGDDIAHAVKQTSDGGYVVTGQVNSFDGDVVGGKGYADVWLIKLNASGTMLWQYVYGGSAGEEQARDIIETSDGGLAIAAYLDGSFNSLIGSDFTTFHNFYDFWVIKTDASGAMEWNGVYGGPSNDIGYALMENASGELMVTGYATFNGCDVDDSHGVIAGYGDYWLLQLGAATCNKVSDLTSSSAFGFATMSWCQAAGALNYELKYRKAGDPWTTFTTFNGNETFYTIGVAPSTTYEWKVRTNCSASTSAYTALQTFVTPAKMGDGLNQDRTLVIYPNPANNKIHIASGDLEENVWLNIYDLHGGLLHQQWLSNDLPEIDISFLAAGIYLVLLSGETGGVTQSATFVKE